MKKCFFFFFFWCPFLVQAASVSSFEVLNGTLSLPFDSENNVYSILLDEDATTALVHYELNDEQASATLSHNEYDPLGENKMLLTVTNADKTVETYTFYLEKEQNVVPVFQTSNVLEEQTKQEIPHLKAYVAFGCSIVILFLFKIIVLGFSKRT